MSILPEENCDENGEKPKQWTHDICRLWRTMAKKREPETEVTPAGSLKGIFNDIFPQKPLVCAICGTGKKDVKGDNQISDGYCSGLIKCAAVGCSVTFHPMCATLVTRFIVETQDVKYEGKSRNEHNLNRKKRIDLDLCHRYTLEMIETTREEGCYGSIPGGEKVNIIPLAFCGIHNPKREPSFYGSHSTGDHFSSMMSIPFQ